MTRSSFQKGYVFTRKTDRGTVHVICYRMRSADGKWRHKAETVNSPRRKDAERILAERLREVNRGLRLPVEISFADYVASHWETYISQNLKPSTRASHRSNVKAHLLPVFGKLRLAEISPLLIMDFSEAEVRRRTEAEVFAESVCAFAEDAQPCGCAGAFELESDAKGSKAQGGANREAYSVRSSG